jgi:hypothetical protein
MWTETRPGALRRQGAPGDEGNERSSHCIYLPTWQSHLAYLACHNPAEPMEFTSDCDPSFSPHRRGFVSYPGLSGHWGRGWSSPPLPPGCLFSLMGPLIQVAPVAAQICGLCSGELSGAWVLGRGSLRGVLPPPLAVALCGPCVFLLWGDLSNLSYLNFARGFHRWLAPLAAAKDTGSRQ